MLWCTKPRFANLRINRDEYRASFGVNSKDHMVLAVGELSSRKNQKIIIEALGTLDRKEQYIFVICGTAVVNSTIEEELKETASRLGVRIFLAGHRLDIPEINACADVAVIPSVREGFGMTGVEALASGVPVVGSDVQGIREYVIPGKTGYLCDPYDAHQFAEAIENIVNLTPEARNQMAAACKKTSKRDEKNTSTAWKTSNFKSEDALISMLYGIPFGTSACGKLFKRNLFKGVEFPYGKFSEDLFTIYKTILKSKSVTYVEFDGYFYYYRDEGSIVVSGYKEKHLEALDAVDDIAGAVKGKTQFDNALSTQYINVIYDIAARNPQPLEFRNKRIQSILKAHRINVLKDGNAPKRLRAFAAISLFGNRIALKVVVARNRKWKV